MKVIWDDDIPNIWKNQIDVPNHQPDIMNEQNKNVFLQMFPLALWCEGFIQGVFSWRCCSEHDLIHVLHIFSVPEHQKPQPKGVRALVLVWV